MSTLSSERAAQFRALHEDGIFVMPCAWDPLSAKLFEEAGFAAIGTTSGGVNWGRGRVDYVYAVEPDVMLDEYGEISAATSLPVSGDLENGYGDTPDDVARTIRGAIERGMVGGSIEDMSSTQPGTLIDPVLAAERVVAAREAADATLANFTLTARAESYYGNVDDPFADAMARVAQYVEAGADCVFVPGMDDPEQLRQLASSVSAAVSVGIGATRGGIDLDHFGELGVRRISTGGAIPRVLYAHTLAMARQMLDEGTFSFTSAAMRDVEVERIITEN